MQSTKSVQKYLDCTQQISEISDCNMLFLAGTILLGPVELTLMHHKNLFQIAETILLEDFQQL